jgi:hypothetical protein
VLLAARSWRRLFMKLLDPGTALTSNSCSRQRIALMRAVRLSCHRGPDAVQYNERLLILALDATPVLSGGLMLLFVHSRDVPLTQ